MDIFNFLTMLGGLALFLYGMNVMGDGLTRASGGRLEKILEKLTSSTIRGVLLGAAVTAVIQSSSATTGSRICKLWYYDTAACRGHHYGCQYRYDNYIMDSQPVRAARRQLLDKDAQAVFIFPDPGDHWYLPSAVFEKG